MVEWFLSSGQPPRLAYIISQFTLNIDNYKVPKCKKKKKKKSKCQKPHSIMVVTNIGELILMILKNIIFNNDAVNSL